MNNPAVSILFCTRNRAEQLKGCLDHIARQNSSCAWELIVIDNGSTDDTGRILLEYAAKMPFQMTVLYEGRRGKSWGMNQGLRVSRGDIMGLIDDDCYVAQDYIDRVREIFDDPRIGFAGGRVDLFDPTDCALTIRTSTEREFLPPGSCVQPGWILGANMMYRRHVLEAIGGFDPELGPGTPFNGGDDTDLQARASFAGWWGLYTPNVIVAHHHRRKEKDARALTRVYARGIGAYRAKFLFIPGTRSIYLRDWLRNGYWEFRRLLRGRYGLPCFWWEIQGAVIYLVRRLRKRVARAS